MFVSADPLGKDPIGPILKPNEALGFQIVNTVFIFKRKRFFGKIQMNDEVFILKISVQQSRPRRIPIPQGGTASENRQGLIPRKQWSFDLESVGAIGRQRQGRCSMIVVMIQQNIFEGFGIKNVFEGPRMIPTVDNEHLLLVYRRWLNLCVPSPIINQLTVRISQN